MPPPLLLPFKLKTAQIPHIFNINDLKVEMRFTSSRRYLQNYGSVKWGKMGEIILAAPKYIIPNMAY